MTNVTAAPVALLLVAASFVPGAAAQQDPFVASVAAATAARDLAKLGELMAAAAAKPVRTDFDAGARYFGTASNYATVLGDAPPSGIDVVALLQPAFECAAHWARSTESAARRNQAAQHAAWLGTGLVDELRTRGAAAAEVLLLADAIPIVAGQRNGAIACVQQADLRVELGRTDDAQRILDRIDLAALVDQDRPDVTALVAACRADLDVRLGNHDEALRRILPWLRCDDRAPLARLDPLIELRLRRTHVGYLLAATRFDEVPDEVADTKKTMQLTAAEAELFDLYALAAASAGGGLDPDRAAAFGEQLRQMATSQQVYVRRWAAVLRAQVALRCEGEAAAAAALADARVACGDTADTAARQCLETTAAALLLRTHRRSGVDAAQLRRQRDAIEQLWHQLQDERANAPGRPTGVAFLHYAFRRDVLAQRVGLALALDDSKRGRAAAADMLLGGGGDSAMLASMRARALVGDDHGVLLYLPGGDASYVFAIDRRRTTWGVIEGTGVLHACMRDVAGGIGDALALTEAAAETDLEARRRTCLQKVESAAANLADKLLPAAIREAMRSWKCVSLVGSEMLPTVPFECLPFGGEPLGHRFALDRWPQVDFAIERAEAARGTGKLRLSFFGKVARSPGDPGLSTADVEASLEGYAEPLMRWESECTIESLRASAAADVLLVLVHGQRVADRVRPHVLCFADGVLGCEEVACLREGHRFVVLAACNAALGPNRFGAATRADLTGAFLDRGATCVAASPFALRLAPTKAFLAATLRALAAGAPPAEALRRARVALAKDATTLQAKLDVWTTGALAAFGHGQRALR